MFINISVILIAQLSLINLVESRKTQKPPVARNFMGDCSRFFGVHLRWVCNSTLTHEVSQNFPDKNAENEASYAMFAPKGLLIFVFITMNSSPLMRCNDLIAMEWNIYICDSIELTLNTSKLYCFNYPMRYFAKLRDECLQYKNVADETIDHSVLHYARVGNRAGFWTINMGLLLLSVAQLWRVL